MSVPSRRSLPSDGRRMVPRMVSSVVLPDPEGPVTITSSPSRTCMLMSNSTSARCGPSP